MHSCWKLVPRMPVVLINLGVIVKRVCFSIKRSFYSEGKKCDLDWLCADRW